jgi:hypothetical protein
LDEGESIMAEVEGLENWQFNFSVEVENRVDAINIFDVLQDAINIMGYRSMNGKMFKTKKEV